MNQQLILFNIKHEVYGVELSQVKTIEKMELITRVPNAPSFVKGVVHYKGIVYPIIDLRLRLGFEEAEVTAETRVIIVTASNIEVALIVDSASDVVDKLVRSKFVSGVFNQGEKLIVVLNLEEVLEKEEIHKLEDFSH
jgi:purine-binding chemotaxis protein CheW